MGGIAWEPHNAGLAKMARYACLVLVGAWALPARLDAAPPQEARAPAPSEPPSAASTRERACTQGTPDCEMEPAVMNRDDFLPAPKGQVRTRLGPARPVIATQRDQARRLALTLAPVVGGLKVPLSGRTGVPVGFGWNLEAEVALQSWLWLTLGWQRLHYLVYAQSRLEAESNEVQPLSSKGWLRWQDFALGVRYALDDGRIRPILEAGVAWTALAQPAGVTEGQSDQACGASQRCDPGLRCVEDRCQPASFPSGYIGAEAQWLLARYFSVGVGARYYASWSAQQGLTFPAQWVVSLRGSVRY